MKWERCISICNRDVHFLLWYYTIWNEIKGVHQYCFHLLFLLLVKMYCVIVNVGPKLRLCCNLITYSHSIAHRKESWVSFEIMISCALQKCLEVPLFVLWNLRKQNKNKVETETTLPDNLPCILSRSCQCNNWWCLTLHQIYMYIFYIIRQPLQYYV